MGTYSIQALRVNNGKTCQEMADMLGITKGAYSKKENGHIQFSAAELLKILDYLHIDDYRIVRV